MALAWQITAAASEEKAPVDGGIQSRSPHLLAMPAGAPGDDVEERADAHRQVRRLANRHRCAGVCGSPEHAQDVEAALQVLLALGLTASGGGGARAAGAKRCRRCGQEKPRTGFNLSLPRPDGVQTFCRSCQNAGRGRAAP